MKNEWPLWEVFIRGQHGLAHRHVGSLHAPDAELAVKNARARGNQVSIKEVGSIHSKPPRNWDASETTTPLRFV